MPDPKPEEEDWFKEFQRVNAPSRGGKADNRRQHARFEVDEATTILYREGLLPALGLGKKNKARAALDLSEGGVRILTSERIPPGTRVRIRIEVDKYKDAIEATGVVRWCYQSTKKATDFFAGAMFVDLPPDQVKKINRMRAWFTSPQYKAMRETRQRQKDSGFTFPK